MDVGGILSSPQSQYTNSRDPQEKDVRVSFEAGERKRFTDLACGFIEITSPGLHLMENGGEVQYISIMR